MSTGKLIVGLSLIAVLSIPVAMIGMDLWAGYIDEDTVWAKSFHEDAFEKVVRGNSEEEVLALLGEPLSKYQLSAELSGGSRRHSRVVGGWQYTLQGSPTSNFHKRIILFDENGKVVRKVKELYID